MYAMSSKTSPTRAPRRVYLHAYERLNSLCAEIQRGRYPTKADLARVVERSARTVQTDLRALVKDFGAPLEAAVGRGLETPRFHVRKDVAPLKQLPLAIAALHHNGFHVRQDVAPLKYMG